MKIIITCIFTLVGLNSFADVFSGPNVLAKNLESTHTVSVITADNQFHSISTEKDLIVNGKSQESITSNFPIVKIHDETSGSYILIGENAQSEAVHVFVHTLNNKSNKLVVTSINGALDTGERIKAELSPVENDEIN